MHPVLHRASEWVHQQLGDTDGRHRLIQAVLVAATAVVLVVPLRPGARPVIPLFFHGPAAEQVQQQQHRPAPATRPHASQLAARPAPDIRRELDFAGQAVSADAQRLAQWVVDSADNGRMNFAILDKRGARVYVFEPGGKLIGESPVLLGYAAGDDTVAGIGKRPIADVKPWERTTPAGRFKAEPGRNAIPEDVLWVDYDAAVSMHRVRLTNPAEHRAERLKSNNAQARRISYGCINMPPAFFEQVLWPNFKQQGGIVYVLPEVKKLDQVFPQISSKLASRLPRKNQLT